MKLRFLLVSGFGLLLAFAGCKNGGKFSGYEKLPSGLYSKFFVSHEGGRKPKMGEFADITVKYFNSKDSLLFTSTSIKQVENGVISQPVFKSSFKGSFEEALMMMAEGDSASFMVNADSVYMKTFGVKELPKFIEKGSYLTFYVKLHKVKTQQELMNELSEKETKLRNAYLTQNNITTAPTESGLYFIEQAPGSGKLIAAGQTVTVKYTGKFLNGKVFDASDLHKDEKPIEFLAGKGQVIRGWDEALLKMKKGGKASLIIPSQLGYGFQENGPIPPFTTLVFDLEVVNVK